MGRVLDTLDQTGHAGDTIVILPPIMDSPSDSTGCSASRTCTITACAFRWSSVGRACRGRHDAIPSYLLDLVSDYLRPDRIPFLARWRQSLSRY